jgi:RNA polymerase sigma-70 factor (ECF subfamily)
MFLSLVNPLKSPMRPPDTRHSLIVRLKDSRNDLAWTEFVCAYEPFLTRLVRKAGNSRPTFGGCDSAVVDCHREICRWLEAGRQDGFFSTMAGLRGSERGHQIYGAGEKACDRPWRIRFSERRWTETVDPSIDAELQRQYEQELILWAAERVRSEFRESSWRAFWETEVIGRSIADVAKDLGASCGSIYMSRSRIFARIRVIIEEVLSDD